MISSLTKGVLEINERSVNCDQEEADQEIRLLQDLDLWNVESRISSRIFREGCQRCHQRKLICSSGHEVYDPVPLRLLSPKEQAKAIESRWVLGPCSAVLQAKFVAKGFNQIVDKESKDSSHLRPQHSNLS